MKFAIVLKRLYYSFNNSKTVYYAYSNNQQKNGHPNTDIAKNCKINHRQCHNNPQKETRIHRFIYHIPLYLSRTISKTTQVPFTIYEIRALLIRTIR